MRIVADRGAQPHPRGQLRSSLRKTSAPPHRCRRSDRLPPPRSGCDAPQACSARRRGASSLPVAPQPAAAARACPAVTIAGVTARPTAAAQARCRSRSRCRCAARRRGSSSPPAAITSVAARPSSGPRSCLSSPPVEIAGVTARPLRLELGTFYDSGLVFSSAVAARSKVGRRAPAARSCRPSRFRRPGGNRGHRRHRGCARFGRPQPARLAPSRHPSPLYRR